MLHCDIAAKLNLFRYLSTSRKVALNHEKLGSPDKITKIHCKFHIPVEPFSQEWRISIRGVGTLADSRLIRTGGFALERR